MTVGHYDPDGKFHPESDHGTSDEAATRAAWLNGAPRDTRRIADRTYENARGGDPS